MRERGESGMLWHLLGGVLIISSIAAILFGVWHITRMPAVTIVNVAVRGGETISHEKVQALVESQLTGNYFLFIPHRFTYLYPKESIIKQLATFPRMHEVQVNRTDRKSIEVTFEEYVPLALLCTSLSTSSVCYFLDEEGYAFAPAPALEGGAFVRHVIEGREELTVGSIFPKEELKKIETFLASLLTELNLRVTDVVHTKDGDLQFFVNGGGKIFVAPNFDLAGTFENLKSIFDSKEFKHLKPGNFNYIDLRFGNKVFVNEELTTSATSSQETLPEQE